MATVKHNKHMDFYEPVPEIFWFLLLGITTVVGIWFLVGILKMLILML